MPETVQDGNTVNWQDKKGTVKTNHISFNHEFAAYTALQIQHERDRT